jgi:hypothetical protein
MNEMNSVRILESLLLIAEFQKDFVTFSKERTVHSFFFDIKI